MTATHGLMAFARQHDIPVDVIDTTQSHFPVPPLKTRLRKAVTKIIRLNRMLLTFKYRGVIIFSSAGLSFYEKIFMALCCRIFMTKVLLFIRSGFFMDDVNQSGRFKSTARLLLRIPHYLGAQGSRWATFYHGLDVPDKKIRLIPNWIDLTEYSVRPNRNDSGIIRFLFVGWIVKEKGVLDLLEAINRLKADKNLEFVFAGDGNLMDSVEAIVEENSLSCVKLLGWQSKEQIKALYRESDVFVLPSHAEGFPNALLEALSCGLPVIATNVGSIADSVITGTNGYLIEPGDIDALTQAIETITASREAMDEFAMNSRKIAEKRHDLSIGCELIFEPFA